MEIAPGVHSIGQKEGGQVRCFLLDDGRALALIDTLWDTDGHRILEEIKRLGRSATDLKHIVLTHAHRSHLGGLATLKQVSRALVCCHPWEADIVQGERRAQPVPILPMRPLSVYYRVYQLQFGAALVTYPIFGAGWPAFVLNRKQAHASLRRMEQFEPEVIGVGHGNAITEDATERLQTLTQQAYQQWMAGQLQGLKATGAEPRGNRQ